MGVCAACGAINPDEDRFCGDCGAPLAPTCPACGEPVAAGRRYCGKCGTPLAAATLGQAAPPTGGTERRRVSVLFCDLVGYTGLSDGQDPEETRELLSGYFDLTRAVIGRYGGVIEKFIGDAVMAVWGAPAAHEDDAERAVRAGLELLDAVASYGASRGVTLAARVGVASGSVATVDALDEGLVVGDRVNLAARVQAAATPGSCYVDDATRRLAGAAVAFEDAGEHVLKGIAEAVRLHRATRVVSGVGGRQRSGASEAPLVGRELELRSLKDLFHASAERRTPRLVVLTGPAGVGKSRLGWELEKYLDGLVDTVLWHRGRCLSYGEGVAFWALAEMVRQRLSIAEEDPTEVAAAKLAEGLVRLVPEEERAYVGARVARLLNVEDAKARAAVLPREELFAGWRLLFERLAGVAPVVLLVDDAQHADAGLVEFLDHLVDWARSLPIFVAVLGRPELTERHGGFGVGRNRTTLSVDPLDGPSMDRLVDALVPGIPPSARAAITGRAQGNPLFAVETARSLVDAGALAPEPDGTYRVVGDLDALEVPDTLQALLAARLDALDPPVRRLVAVASVIGSSFPAGALVAVSGSEAGEVQAALDELVRRDVLEVSADPLSPQQGDYRFAQELLRQVAYDTLSRRERKARHLAVAAHLRTAFAHDAEEMAEVVARHYLDALDAADIRAEAIAMSERAGARAETAGTPTRAAASYATAARLVAGDATRPDAERDRRAAALWERAAEAALLAGEWDTAIAHAQAAGACHEHAGEARGAARARSLTGSALRQAGRHGEARPELDAALAVLRADPDADTVQALSELSGLELLGGTLDEGERLAVEALALGQALDVDDRLLARLFNARGIAHALAGRMAEAGAYYRESARLAEAAGAGGDLGVALGNLADVLGGVDPAGAAHAARAALGHARLVGALGTVGFAAANLATALLELGRWEEAAVVLHEAVEGDGLGDDEYVNCLVGLLAALRGQLEAAGAALERLDRFAASENVQTQATITLLRAHVAVAAGDPAGGVGHARAVLGRAGAIGVRHETIRWAWPLAARLASELGEEATLDEALALLDGQPAGHLPPALRAERDLARARLAASHGDAGDLLADAVAALRRLDSPYRLAGGLLDLAEHLAAVGDPAGAGAALDEAAEIAARLGCQPLAERASRLGQQLPTR